MPCLNKSGSGKRPQTVWGNPKKESIPKYTNETPMVVEISLLTKRLNRFKCWRRLSENTSPVRLIKESKHILKESKKKDKPKKEAIRTQYLNY